MNSIVVVRWHRRLWAAVSVLLAATLAGCGGGDGTVAVPEASATIGAAGGTLAGPDGMQIIVPPGALSAPTAIRIARTAVGAPQVDPDGYTPAGPVYEVTPHGLSFNLPVTIRMPAAAMSGAEASNVFAASPGEDWRVLESTLANGQASWDTLSFSWFQLAACYPDPNDPYTCAWPRIVPRLTAANATAAAQIIDGLNQKVWRITQATSLRMALSLTAAADCVRSPRVTVRPRIATNTGADFGDAVFDQDVIMLADPANPKLARQTVNWDFSLSSADNGTKWFSVQFSCERLNTGRRQSISGDAVFLVDAAPTPPLPAFTAPPADASVVAPEAATFTVAATGVPEPSVQWQRSIDDGATWSDIVGATAAIYTTPATTLADNGSLFRAVASNAGGSATSASARLGVVAPTGGSWHAALTVAAGGLNFHPSVGFDGNGRALAVWMPNRPAAA